MITDFGGLLLVVCHTVDITYILTLSLQQATSVDMKTIYLQEILQWKS